MKILEFKCDTCERSFPNEDRLLRIGSEDGDGLLVNNNLPDHAIISMNRYKDIHFCSKECFVSYFFNSECKP